MLCCYKQLDELIACGQIPRIRTATDNSPKQSHSVPTEANSSKVYGGFCWIESVLPPRRHGRQDRMRKTGKAVLPRRRRGRRVKRDRIYIHFLLRASAILAHLHQRNFLDHILILNDSSDIHRNKLNHHIFSHPTYIHRAILMMFYCI